MAQQNQIPRVDIPNASFTYKNYSGSDIAEGTALKLDASNNGGGTTSAPRGVLPTSAATGFIGFAVATIKAGATGPVQRLGMANAIAGAAISIGDWLMTNASGQVVLATAGAEVIGKAEQAAGAATDRLAVWITQSKNA